MGQGQVAPQPLDLFGGDRVAGQAEEPGRLQRGQVAGIDRGAGGSRYLGRGRSRPTGSGSQALTITGPSCTPALSSKV